MKHSTRIFSASFLLLASSLGGCKQVSWMNPDGSFPEPTEDLQPDTLCESALDAPVPGATSYFVGDFELSGDNVTGTEYWMLFANTPWHELDGEDCEVRWSVEGTKGEPMACAACNYSLTLDMEVDRSASTCPEGLTPAQSDAEAAFSVSYDVSIAENGETTFYFESGSLLGTGYSHQGRLTYVSEGTCKWF